MATWNLEQKIKCWYIFMKFNWEKFVVILKYANGLKMGEITNRLDIRFLREPVGWDNEFNLIRWELINTNINFCCSAQEKQLYKYEICNMAWKILRKKDMDLRDHKYKRSVRFLQLKCTQRWHIRMLSGLEIKSNAKKI